MSGSAIFPSGLREGARRCLAGLFAASFAVAATGAAAEPAPISRYTAFDLDKPGCRMDPGPAEGATCAGTGGWAVTVGFPAIGASVAIVRPGRPRPSQEARDGKLVAFDGMSPSGSRVEWRGVERAGRFEPFAAIVRMSVLDAAQRQETIETGHAPAKPLRTQILVVFRLGAEGSCQVAYVDAQANANELARGAADGTARTATCPVDHVAVVGRSSPVLDGYLR